MQYVSTTLRLHEAEANAAHNGNCLYFRCSAPSRNPGGPRAILFYYHGHSTTKPEDLTLNEACGPFILINFKAKDHSRPYQYLRERTWIPVKFARPPQGTKWEFQAISTRYFGQLHAEPRDCRTINEALRQARRPQSPASAASQSPISTHTQSHSSRASRLVVPNNTPVPLTRDGPSNTSTSSSASSQTGCTPKNESSTEEEQQEQEQEQDLQQEEEEPYEEVYEGG